MVAKVSGGGYSHGTILATGAANYNAHKAASESAAAFDRLKVAEQMLVLKTIWIINLTSILTAVDSQ